MTALPASSPLIVRLRAQIAAIERRGAGAMHAALPFGVAALDTALPGGGLARGALHEISGGARDPHHAAAATLFAAGIAARLGESAPVLWCVTRRDLFAPGLAAVGLHPDGLIHAEAGNDAGVLQAVEEGVRHSGLAAVVGEVRRLPLVAARRLQLAAENSGVTVLMLLRGDREAEPGAALTRWEVEAGPSTTMSRALWRVRLVRARGAAAGEWLVEGCDAQGRLAVLAALVDRPVAAEPRAHAA